MQGTLQAVSDRVEPAPVRALSCRICGNSDTNGTHMAREMMFGSGDAFDYLECSRCGCLQLLQVPEDPATYYGENYYAYRGPSQGVFKSFLRRRLVQHALGKKNLMGMALSMLCAAPGYCDWFRKCSVAWESAILDVGCGIGGRILKMRSDGFRNLTGIDPYIEGDIAYDCGVNVYKRHLCDMDDEFDFIMLNHTFEHMEDPFAVMRDLHRLLKPGGYVLVRIPVAGSYAWRTYGVHWVQLDAPRHVFLHTPQSIAVLASQSGFNVADVTYDSYEFQFWGSEQYKRGISLMDARSYSVDPRKSIFSREQVKAFRARSAALNRTNEGDSACFFLQKAQPDSVSLAAMPMGG